MAGRTIAVGDIHGEIEHLRRILADLPELDADDTLVFLGDYVDRGPCSRQVLELLMSAADWTPAKVVCLRGNHEDAWLRVCEDGWDEFVFPPSHGCLAMLRSFTGEPMPESGESPTDREMGLMASGEFIPHAVVAWLDSLPFWYEDENGIYIHAGLPRSKSGGFLHPRDVQPPARLAWMQSKDFALHYRGKNVFFGHTPTDLLPQELSLYTPDDPSDLFETEDTFGLDTGCGSGGFLTAIELPSMRVYESRLAAAASGRRRRLGWLVGLGGVGGYAGWSGISGSTRRVSSVSDSCQPR